MRINFWWHKSLLVCRDIWDNLGASRPVQNRERPRCLVIHSARQIPREILPPLHFTEAILAIEMPILSGYGQILHVDISFQVVFLFWFLEAEELAKLGNYAHNLSEIRKEIPLLLWFRGKKFRGENNGNLTLCRPLPRIPERISELIVCKINSSLRKA